MYRLVAVIGLIVLLVAGCGSRSGQTLAPATATSAGGGRAAGTTPGAEDVAPNTSAQAPVAVALSLAQEQPAVGVDVGVTLLVRPGSAVAQAQSALQGSGVVKVVEAQPAHWRDLAAGQEVRASATIQITGLGEGVLSGAVEVRDAAGQTLFRPSDTLYVLAAEEGVFTGRSGQLELKLARLARARELGKLTDEEYQRALEQTQYGGATSEITIVVPTKQP